MAQAKLAYYGQSVGNPWDVRQGSLTIICAGGETLVFAFVGVSSVQQGAPTDSNGTIVKHTASEVPFWNSGGSQGAFYTEVNAAAGVHVITPPAVAGGQDGLLFIWKVTGMPSTLNVRTYGKLGGSSSSLQTRTVTTVGNANAGDMAFGIRGHENSVGGMSTLSSPPSGWDVHEDSYLDGTLNLPTEACRLAVASSGSTVSATWVSSDTAITDTTAMVLVLVPTCQCSIKTQPAGQNAPVGSTATFTVSAVGVTAYQWQVSTDAGASWSNVSGGSGGTTASYTTPTVTGTDHKKRYRVNLSDGTNSVNSEAALFTIPGTSSAKGRYPVLGSWATKFRARGRTNPEQLLRKVVQFGDLNATEATVWKDWFFGTSAPSSVSLSATQSVPDASLAATAAAVDSTSVSQSVPDATLTATATTQSVRSLSATQSVPDASLTATVTVTAKASGTQSVPDATLAATVTVTDKASATQTVPDAALTATAQVTVKASATQAVPDATLTATALGTVKVSATQVLADATLVATAVGIVKASAAQVLPDATLTVTVAVTGKASATQAVPDATIAASGQVTVKASATQAVPDAALTASVSSTNSRMVSATQVVPDATLSAGAHVVDTAGATQTVPDAVLVASAAVVVKAVSAQVVPDAVQVAHVGPQGYLTATQTVPDAALVATAKARDSISSSQAVPDAALSAGARVTSHASATQVVPDATLVARVGGKTVPTQRVPDAVLWARVAHVVPLQRPTPQVRTLGIAPVDRTLVIPSDSAAA